MSGEWHVACGVWRVASGEWQVASGEWQVVSGSRWQYLQPATAVCCGRFWTLLLPSLIHWKGPFLNQRSKKRSSLEDQWKVSGVKNDHPYRGHSTATSGHQRSCGIGVEEPSGKWKVESGNCGLCLQ